MQRTGPSKLQVAIVGGGPSALMLACSLNRDRFNIDIYEKNAAPGRKFLVAGQGGFNLTHSEPLESLIGRYHPPGFMDQALRHFDNKAFRAWLAEIGIETYVGSSKRVFPVEGTKPVKVLKAIEKKLKGNKVTVHYRHEWKGWNRKQLLFVNDGKKVLATPDIVVFALGGGSWKVTGSAGDWLPLFEKKGIASRSFEASNCAYQVAWKAELLKEAEGKALKNCVFTCNGQSKKGEAVITSFGIEGSGVYPLAPLVRGEFAHRKTAMVFVDMKPGMTTLDIASRISKSKKGTIREKLENDINLSEAQVALIRNSTTKLQYNNPAVLAHYIKFFPIPVTGLAPLDDAISTVGGIPLNEVDQDFQLLRLPGHYCIGEMLDWDAPTGGYLLQACFSMGKYLADHLNTKSR